MGGGAPPSGAQGYSWFCTWGSFLAPFGDYMGCQVSNPIWPHAKQVSCLLYYRSVPSFIIFKWRTISCAVYAICCLTFLLLTYGCFHNTVESRTYSCINLHTSEGEAWRNGIYSRKEPKCHSHGLYTGIPQNYSSSVMIISETEWREHGTLWDNFLCVSLQFSLIQLYKCISEKK